MRAAWIRIGIPIALLVLGALVAGGLAWREAERARATAQILMRDYASFIADNFARMSSARYLNLLGFSSQAPESGSTLALLRAYRETGGVRNHGELPLPNQGFVDYIFVFDFETGRLATSGRNPPAREREALIRFFSTFDPKCGPDQVIPFPRFGDRYDLKGLDPSESLTAGLVETDARGAVLRVYGLSLSPSRSVERIFVPVVTRPDECGCENLLPKGLEHLKDARQAASFVLRDAARRILYSSEPRYRGPGVVQQTISPQTPFAGWTVEVTVNPAVIQPFLPYGGRGAPWAALVVIGLLILGAGSLALLALRRESQLLQLQQDFVANVSHELKTPLARIRLFNDLLLGGSQKDGAKQMHYRVVIDRECRRLTLLVERILDFSRLQRGVRKYERKPVDLRATFEEALEVFRAASDQGRYVLNCRLEPAGTVSGDKLALQQVFFNLLDNAVKYSPEGSSIDVFLTSDGRNARLSIADSGPGIPEREQQRIFEPFYRAPASGDQKDCVSGSGLGLSLVRRAVEAHSGEVTVSSSPGKGSTFSVTIPILQDGVRRA